MKKLKIAYFYKDQLNLYGDNGNVEILSRRAALRGFVPEVLEIGLDSKMDSSTLLDVQIVFMGGGPDSGQKQMYEDLLQNKKEYLRDYLENNGVGLVICGSYQLFGHYYKASDGSTLEGLGLFDLYTHHFGSKKPRCIGNTVAQISPKILSDPYFIKNNHTSNLIVGFENHGGRTFLQHDAQPLGKIIKGSGNNSVDKSEGIYYKNFIGTYFHGPFLSKNPHLADFILSKGLDIPELKKLPDSLINSAHLTAQKLKH